MFVAREGDGIVEVARGGRVDRHAEEIPEVLARPDLGFVESLGLIARLIEDVLIEGVGDVERADDRQRIDARHAPLAEDLGDDPLAFLVRTGVSDDLDGHLVAGPGSLGARVADVDGVVKRRAVDPDESETGFLEIRADEDPRGPRQDLDDPPLIVHPRPTRCAW